MKKAFQEDHFGKAGSRKAMDEVFFLLSINRKKATCSQSKQSKVLELKLLDGRERPGGPG